MLFKFNNIAHDQNNEKTKTIIYILVSRTLLILNLNNNQNKINKTNDEAILINICNDN
jgi:hypothetical protein